MMKKRNLIKNGPLISGQRVRVRKGGTFADRTQRLRNLKASGLSGQFNIRTKVMSAKTKLKFRFPKLPIP